MSALKALRLRKQIDQKKRELENLRSKKDEFAKREAELAAAIDEVDDNTSAEDKETLDSEIESFDKEQEEHEKNISGLENEIAGLEKELSELPTENTGRSAVPTGEHRDFEKETEHRDSGAKPKEREMAGKTEAKVKAIYDRENFFGLSAMEREAFFARDDVHDFLERTRSIIGQKRSITNADLTIPDVMLPMLKQIVRETSKLIGRTYTRPVSGTARQTIMGSIPEAIWTEMCATLNELNLGFNQTEVDGYKVGGFFAVCNAILEDNDVNLASELITALGKSIGKALDKAIIYGTGTKMPLGFVTRLAQSAAPANYSAKDRAWADLHTSNIITGTGASGIALFQEIVGNTGVILNDYYENGITWIMNQKTHTKLLMQSMDRDMNAAIVAGMSNSMPVLGGDIVELPFIPDDNIAFGYLDAYLLAERAGTQIGQSEHYRFIEDQTVLKGTARYDGKPVIAEAFALMTITNAAPTTSVTFPADTANTGA